MASNFKKNFGKRVKSLRKIQGITQEQLAEQLNVSTVSIANIETGRSAIGFSRLPLLAKILDVEIYQLFSDLEKSETSNIKGEIVTLIDVASRKQLNVIHNIIEEILKL